MTDMTSREAHARALARADEAARRGERAREDTYYPAYHIAARAGWINDPNGLVQFEGRTHVFFQYHPYGTEWGPMHWGHVSSADLVSWRHEPCALAPSCEADRDGCWSGSAVVGDDGRLYLIYTGNRWRRAGEAASGKVQTQCVAVSDDGIHFEKVGAVLVDKAYEADFRDPKVFRLDGRWHMVVARRATDGRGEIACYVSDDLLSWQEAGVVYRCEEPGVGMLECPDLFRLGAHWVLVFCAMGLEGRDAGQRASDVVRYLVGSWEPGGRLLGIGGPRPLDAGPHFYAPQSFETSDGRRLQLAWMRPREGRTPERANGHCGQLTAMRELALTEDLTLTARPVAAYGKLFADGPFRSELLLRPLEMLVLASDLTCGRVRLTIVEGAATLLLHATHRDGLLVLSLDAEESTVTLYEDAAPYGEPEPIRLDVRPGALSVEVLLDRGSVEVFADRGRQVLSTLSYPGAGRRNLKLVADATVRICDLWVSPLGRGSVFSS